MPLTNGYGVVAGTVASFSREQPDPGGRPTVGVLRLKTAEDEWEATLDVSTPQSLGVQYRVASGVAARWMPRLADFPDGLHRLGPTYESGALDYLRSPMLRPGWAITWPWRMLLRGLGAVAESAGLRIAVRNPGHWHDSHGDDALGALELLLNRAARVFVFGEPGADGHSMRNVHLNQGNPPGARQAEDGVWQDGAVVTQDAAGRYAIWQIRFNSQSRRTDSAGRPA
jgi:uncharacterized protein DUF2278